MNPESGIRGKAAETIIGLHQGSFEIVIVPLKIGDFQYDYRSFSSLFFFDPSLTRCILAEKMKILLCLVLIRDGQTKRHEAAVLNFSFSPRAQLQFDDNNSAVKQSETRLNKPKLSLQHRKVS